jgi:hypothetical protein
MIRVADSRTENLLRRDACARGKVFIVLEEIALARQQGYPDRGQFVDRLARIKEGESKATVEALLGKPDDIWRDAYEVWCYGSAEHRSLPTLGRVYFWHNRVAIVVGRLGRDDVPPSPNVLSEHDLRDGIRFMDPGRYAIGINDPLHLVRVTNYLQPLGKEKALTIMGEYGRVRFDHWMDNIWLFLLLRTLFDVPNPPGFMPELRIWGKIPEPPRDPQLIPRFPIVIVDDIPFIFFGGFRSDTPPPPISTDIVEFRRFGKVRTSVLRPPDDPFLSFKNLRESKEWGYIAASNERPDFNEGDYLRQVLALVRTVYDPPEARRSNIILSLETYDRHHQAFLQTGAHWDERLQMYVHKDGTHGKIGQVLSGFES